MENSEIEVARNKTKAIIEKEFNRLNLSENLYDLEKNEPIEEYFLDEEEYEKKVVNFAYEDLDVKELERFTQSKSDFSFKDVEDFFSNCEISIDYETWFNDCPYGRIHTYKNYSLKIDFDSDSFDLNLNFEIQEWIEDNKEEFYDFVLEQRYIQKGGDEKFKDNYMRNADIVPVDTFDDFLENLQEDELTMSADEFISTYLNFEPLPQKA